MLPYKNSIQRTASDNYHVILAVCPEVILLRAVFIPSLLEFALGQPFKMLCLVAYFMFE